MCDKCPAERERITAKYGVVVVAMLYSQAEHALTYNIHLGGRTGGGDPAHDGGHD